MGIGALMAFVRRRPDARELSTRGRQWIMAHSERLAPGLLVHTRPAPAANTVKAVARRLREGGLGTFFAGADVVLESLDGPARARAVALADAAVAGRFDLLGYEGLCFGNPPDWHLEPVSGKRSPLVPWKDLDSLDPTLTGDKKIVWELNRHQHLLLLGLAYRHTGDRRYADTFAAHVRGWIAQNPPSRGINWVSSLELSFRVISWISALHLFRDAPQVTDDLLAPMLDALVRHGEHLAAFLSTYSSPNTHLTGEALGLYYLGTCLAELDRGGRWKALGRGVLLEQLDHHVRPDGVYFEQSTWYHRYTTDFYTHLALLAERAGDREVPSLGPRIQALMEHLLWVTHPDGSSPYLGDDDGGTLLRLIPGRPDDWRTVLSTGAVLFGRGDFKAAAGSIGAETVWWFGRSGIARYEALGVTPPPRTARAFPDGGFYAMRDGWSSSANHLVLDCGPHGTMNCGHAHADALSVVVAARGTPVIVDPGTYAYTASSEDRDRFRSTAVHNTVTVDGEGASLTAGPFQWRHVAACRTACWHDHPRFTFVAGSHDGYRRLADPVVHGRSVLFIKGDYWLVLDTLEGRAEHRVEAHFQFAPGFDVSIDPSSGRLSATGATVALDLIPVGPAGAWATSSGWVSRAYGRRVAAPAATHALDTTGGGALLTLLFPREPPELSPTVVSGRSGSSRSARIASPSWSDDVRWRPAHGTAEDSELADFEWVWVRRASGGPPKEAILLHGSTFKLGGIELTAATPVACVVAEWTAETLVLDVVPATRVSVRALAGPVSLVMNGLPAEAGANGHTTSWDLPDSRAAFDAADCCGHVRY